MVAYIHPNRQSPQMNQWIALLLFVSLVHISIPMKVFELKIHKPLAFIHRPFTQGRPNSKQMQKFRCWETYTCSLQFHKHLNKSIPLQPTHIVYEKDECNKHIIITTEQKSETSLLTSVPLAY